MVQTSETLMQVAAARLVLRRLAEHRTGKAEHFYLSPLFYLSPNTSACRLLHVTSRSTRPPSLSPSRHKERDQGVRTLDRASLPSPRRSATRSVKPRSGPGSGLMVVRSV